MGGLVARAMCHPDMGKAELNELVAGVVHGEQPAVGAAAAYKRMHAGFEARWWNLVELITARALGWSGKEVTSVFANSPGAMQLLPTKRYPKGWLRIKAGAGKNLMELPVSNPYEEIYKVREKWWRLMTPEWINPDDTNLPEEQLDTVWRNYEKRVDIVEDFHDKLDDYYHGVTHAHYGADDRHKTWKNITWHLEERNANQYEWPDRPPPEATNEAPQAAFVKSDAQGKVTIRFGSAESNYRLAKHDSPGDGTVPECSGEDTASKAEFATKMKGYDHQGSYSNKAVKDVTTYSVMRIAINKC